MTAQTLSPTISNYGKMSTALAKSLKPMARALLLTITCLINRQKNELQISITDLAEESGMSRPSIIKWIDYLEKLGHLYVKRNKGGTHNDVNVYKLTGEHAKTALWNNKGGVVKNFDEQRLKNLTRVVKNFDGKALNTNEKKKEIINVSSTASISGEFLALKSEEQDPQTKSQDAQPPKQEIKEPPAPQTKIKNNPMLGKTRKIKASDAWNATANQLELQLGRQTFDTWLKNSEFSSVENDVFIINVRNEQAQNMLQYRLYRNIRRVLQDVLGTITEIKFNVPDKSTAKSAIIG